MARHAVMPAKAGILGESSMQSPTRLRVWVRVPVRLGTTDSSLRSE
jgi:hypothetical protein